MNYKTTTLTSLMFALVFGSATATPSHIYSNTITAHNIAAIQYSITQNAFNAFMGSMATATQQHVNYATGPATTDNSKIYGRAPMYGTASIYGEYNDGMAGRNGGDRTNADAALNNIWLGWHHLGDNAKFDEMSRLDTDMETVAFGIAGGQSKIIGGTSKWGLYTGYIGGTQENQTLSLDEQGGYLGIYNGFLFNKLNLYTTINGGVLSNTAKTTEFSDEYTNFWLGGAINATYNIALDSTFTIQPGIQLGYTWIKSENYTSASGDIIKNDAFSMFQIAPALRAIKHIGNGWYGSINAAYTITLDNGGDTSVNDIKISGLETSDFIEYSLSLEKQIQNFTASINFGRRDGGRDGWIGGLNIKYLF